MAVMTVNSMAIVVPIIVSVIRRTIPIVSIGPVISVRVITISIGIVAIPVTRITEPDSDRDLSVRTLHGNESQSAYHQCNQEHFFHCNVPFLVCWFARGENSLLRNRSTR